MPLHSTVFLHGSQWKYIYKFSCIPHAWPCICIYFTWFLPNEKPFYPELTPIYSPLNTLKPSVIAIPLRSLSLLSPSPSLYPALPRPTNSHLGGPDGLVVSKRVQSIDKHFAHTHTLWRHSFPVVPNQQCLASFVMLLSFGTAVFDDGSLL